MYIFRIDVKYGLSAGACSKPGLADCDDDGLPQAQVERCSCTPIDGEPGQKRSVVLQRKGVTGPALPDS